MPTAPRFAPPAAIAAAIAAAIVAAAGPVRAEAPSGGAAALLAAAAGASMPGVEGVALIPGWRRADGARVAAIELRLAPGWHTYWRAPGANGLPPQFDWSGSRNLASVAYEWPRPRVIDLYGGPTLGYPGILVLPVVLTPVRPEAPVDVRLDLFFGVCDDICIPTEARLSATLAPGAPAEGRADIERALADRALDPAAAGVTRARCGLEPGADGPRIAAEVTFDAPPSATPVAVIEAETRPDLWIGAAATRLEGRTLTASAPLGGSGALALDRGALRLTLVDDARAIDIQGCPGG